ncbi:MAG: ABC transporter permease [Gammaproteobacteria bacterium]
MSHELWLALLSATGETLYMLLVAGSVSILLGLPLGILLFCTRPQQILARPLLNRMLAAVVNALRSVPFIILLVAIIPLTRVLVGTSIGTTAAIVPLTIGAIPFVARIVENALDEVPAGLIEAGIAMGASPLQIIQRFLVPEALPAIVNGVTVTLVTLLGYSAMAGAVGGGGLGDLAIRYGYQRFEVNVMIATIIVLIVLVQLIQMLGDRLANLLSH